MELTAALVKNIVNVKYDDLPADTREATKISILDTLGVMFPPTKLEKGCISLAELMIDAGGNPESTVIGFGHKSPCWMAAFVNGSLAHALDFDDTTDNPPHHPTASTFPAALAIAERINHISGKDFITAVAAANDLGLRLASAPVGKLYEDYPWFSVTIFGAFSAATAVGKLLDLPEEQLINALGIALHRVFGITEAMTAPGSEMRAIRDGFTNKEGTLAGLMAAKGISACKDSVEKLMKFYYRNEFDPLAITTGLGTSFKGSAVSLKPWPCDRVFHGYIQAAQDIMRENNIQQNEIQEVMLTISKHMAESFCEPLIQKQNPQLSIDAKFSLPFTVGIAMAKGKVEIGNFLPQNLKSNDVLKMAKTVTYEIDAGLEMMGPALTRITTANGEVFSKKIKEFYGHPKNPMTKADRHAKFRDCASYYAIPFSTGTVDRLIEKISNLENVGNIHEITDLLIN